jgi:hypothetical protein
MFTVRSAAKSSCSGRGREVVLVVALSFHNDGSRPVRLVVPDATGQGKNPKDAATPSQLLTSMKTQALGVRLARVWKDLRENCSAITKKPPEAVDAVPAAAYFPTQLPGQYRQR